MLSPSLEELESTFQELKAILAHPEFQKAAEEVLNVSTEQRGQALLTQLAPDALAAKGVQLPSALSISVPRSGILNPSNSTDVDATEPEGAGQIVANEKLSNIQACGGIEIRLGNTTICIISVPRPHISLP